MEVGVVEGEEEEDGEVEEEVVVYGKRVRKVKFAGIMCGAVCTCSFLGVVCRACWNCMM